MYAFAASWTAGRCEDWSRGDVRLCFFRASLNTLRLVVASKGRDGCVLLVRNSDRFAELVVGRANGNGISSVVDCWLGGGWLLIDRCWRGAKFASTKSSRRQIYAWLHVRYSPTSCL